jgi:dihydrofolate reductase
MGRLSVFNSVSVDGYFTGVDGDYSWAHENQEDAEFRDFVAGNARGEGTLLFGRKTYELMARFWPTPAAAQQFPVVAERMNGRAKIVFSRTLKDAPWQNTTVVGGELVAEVRRLKREGEGDLVILGSGSIVAQLTKAGLVDEFQVLVVPVVIGAGRTMFDGCPLQRLRVTRTHAFKSGNLYTVYEPRS